MRLVSWDLRASKVFAKVSDEAKAEAAVKEMCEKLLANTVIESYSVELV